MVRYSFILLLTPLFYTCGRAQVVGYVDSVEVHRTDTIYFDFGSDVLDETALQAVAQLVADRPAKLELYLEGHTDAVGSNNANEALAEARSKNTLAAALDAGWPADAVEIRHFGERRLEVRTGQRERRNRRVLLRSGKPRRYARFYGRITNEAGLPLPGGVIAHGRYLQDTVRADESGRYELFLPLDEDLRLDIYAENHFFTSQHISLKEAQQVTDPLVTQLPAATPGAKMSVPDLYFVSNKADLLKESFPTLPRLLQFMRTSPELSIELAGHVNGPGPPKGVGTWQFTLAYNRAKFVYDYLVHFGINPNRMRYRGYSNFEMIYPNPKGEHQMRWNRRVEIRVLGDAGS
ncbi:MAG: OmpA family protein [Bacteroidota bacterium]